MVIFNFDKQKHYSILELERLGFERSKLPYVNYRVYIKNKVFYLFKELKTGKLQLDSINY